MAYNELLADRIRLVMDLRKSPFAEKKMMGGLCFMVDEKMCCGIIADSLMARIGPDVYDEALTKPGCREMDFTGRKMTGYVYVDGDGIDMEEDLEYWVGLCLDFNPMAKASKKKKKKSV